jgi:hypothetical protein
MSPRLSRSQSSGRGSRSSGVIPDVAAMDDDRAGVRIGGGWEARRAVDDGVDDDDDHVRIRIRIRIRMALTLLTMWLTWVTAWVTCHDQDRSRSPSFPEPPQLSRDGSGSEPRRGGGETPRTPQPNKLRRSQSEGEWGG